LEKKRREKPGKPEHVEEAAPFAFAKKENILVKGRRGDKMQSKTREKTQSNLPGTAKTARTEADQAGKGSKMGGNVTTFLGGKGLCSREKSGCRSKTSFLGGKRKGWTKKVRKDTWKSAKTNPEKRIGKGKKKKKMGSKGRHQPRCTKKIRKFFPRRSLEKKKVKRKKKFPGSGAPWGARFASKERRKRGLRGSKGGSDKEREVQEEGDGGKREDGVASRGKKTNFLKGDILQ